MKIRVFTHITSKYTEESVRSRIDDLIPEFLNDDWEDEFDDINEAYSETGRGEAESQVIQETIKEAMDDTGLTLSDDDQYWLSKEMQEFYEISTE